MIIAPGATNQSVSFNVVQDAGAAAPGEPKTGMVFGDLTSASYVRQGAARVAITPITLASPSAAHADGGFIEVDATNTPGLYRFDPPDAAFASGVSQVVVIILPAAGQNAVAYPLNVDISTLTANLTEISGNAQSAIDLKDFADDGYDPATNKVQGVVLVDTTTANTDMRGTDSALLAASINLTAGAVDNVTLVATTTANTDMRGTDGVDTATMRGTDNAALASVATEARLAELDPANLPTTTDATLVDTGTTIPAQITALNDISVTDILTTQMAQSYAADGVAPTLAQALFLIQQILGDFAISGTTLTVREIDGATTAATFTLDSATVPTSLTRTT